MKKLRGWIQIVLCSTFLLIFAFALIIMFLSQLAYNYEIRIPVNDILITIAGFLLVVALLIVGLINGIKTIKKSKVVDIIEYNKILEINFSGRINYTEYRNLIIGLSFKRPMYLVLLSTIFLFTIPFIINRAYMINNIDSYLFVFIFYGVYLLSPVFNILQIRKLYNSNKNFQEPLNYILTNESINIKGNTIESTLKWTHFIQIKETKNFFLFYTGKSVATLLDKKMFSESDLQEFHNFFKSLNNKRI